MPALAATSAPTIGESFSITLANARPNSLAGLIFGEPSVAVPIGPCALIVLLRATIIVPTKADGTASLKIALPYDAALAGTVFGNQWLVADSLAPLGFTMSNGGQGVVGSRR